MRRVAAFRGSLATPAPFIFQQDSAPAHCAKKTLDYLKSENINFFSPAQWPPNSPDLNQWTTPFGRWWFRGPAVIVRCLCLLWRKKILLPGELWILMWSGSLTHFPPPPRTMRCRERVIFQLNFGQNLKFIIIINLSYGSIVIPKKFSSFCCIVFALYAI